jgi:hypothetical protein
VLLLAADLVFVVVHILAVKNFLPRECFSVEQDHAPPEIFQYVKEFWAALLLGGVAWRLRSAHFGAWAVAFLYMLADDSLTLHEQAGEWLAQQIHLWPIGHLRPQDIGELIYLSAMGGLILVMLGVTYLRSSTAVRSYGWRLLAMLLVFGVFSVALDVMHQMLEGTRVFGLSGLLEDGGEMVVMSALLAYSFAIFLTFQKPKTKTAQIQELHRVEATPLYRGESGRLE